MCGISGAVGRIDPEILSAVRCMTAAQRHRGPDDEGFWTSHEGSEFTGACFGFRRLAIIDLSADAHQPMVDRHRGDAIVFNGEIYNYQALRQELAIDGESFGSRSDTEVLLKSYGRWGMACVEKLRGMFAFAIWNRARQQVELARDRLGIKPLYVATIERPGGRTLLFASELRSLLATSLLDRRLDPEGVRSFIWNGFVIGPQTIIRGIQMFPPGCLATVNPAGATCEITRYWSLPSEQAAGDGVDRLRDELHTAVQQHLASDVPLGVFLSGGIDSSAVAAMAADAAGSRDAVQTFNISFDESQFDESRYALAIAEAVGTVHHDIRLTAQTFRSGLDGALESIDQPTFDAINTYFVSRSVRDAGITVALAGTGGDELFGGYRSFLDLPRAVRVSRNLRHVPNPLLRAVARQIARLKSGRFGEVPPQTRWGKLADVFGTRGDLVDAYQVSYALFTEEFQTRLLPGEKHFSSRGLPPGRAHELRHLIDGSSISHQISTLELSNFIGERLLRDTDAASMAVSLEVRVPLLDHLVVEAAAGVEPSTRFNPLGRKHLLRRLAMAKIDPALFDRPKSGFVLPIDTWCRQELKNYMNDVFLGQGDLCERVGLNKSAVASLWRSFEAGAPGMYWSRIWAIFVLLWWCRRHGVEV